jgi:hypothetical protein
VAGGPPSAVCIYDEDTDELYFAEKPQVNFDVYIESMYSRVSGIDYRATVL